jgi:hypothetical protein
VDGVMAKLRVPKAKILEAALQNGIFATDKFECEIHRAWVEGDDIVLDLRGSSVPEAEEVTVTHEMITRDETWRTSRSVPRLIPRASDG